jgi:uncharacterized membrane protein YoaK (UPF0700 family)
MAAEDHASDGSADGTRPLLVGLFLTVLAGWIDAVGFLRLGGLYASFMSGNTTQLGIFIGGRDWSDVGTPALLIALFVAGAFTSAFLDGLMIRWGVALSFALQSILLAAAAALSLSDAQPVLALAPLPMAMGLQNICARRMTQGGAGITFVTGTLVRLGEALAAMALGRPSRWSRPALIWLAMVAGAVAGAVAQSAAPELALLAPFLGALAMTVLALRSAAMPATRSA